MAKAKTARTLSRAEAAWLAGLIDGDGSISLTRRHRNENRQLEISVANTDLNLLRVVKSLVGLGRITHKRIVSERHTPGGAYLISNRQALSLLVQLLPYLRTYKARRARLVVENYVRLTPRNGVYTIELMQERRQFEREFLELNPKLYQRRIKDR